MIPREVSSAKVEPDTETWFGSEHQHAPQLLCLFTPLVGTLFQLHHYMTEEPMGVQFTSIFSPRPVTE